MAARRRRPAAGAGARDTLTLLALALCAPGVGGGALEWYSAMVGIEYVDPLSNQTVKSVSESGRFGDSSPRENKQGLVGVPRADENKEGCAPDTRFVAPGGLGAAPWVALVARGVCTFKDKVLAAARRNASAVVVYNLEHYGNATEPMSHAGEQAGRGAALRGRGEPAGFPGGVEREVRAPTGSELSPRGGVGRCVRRPGSDLSRGLAKDLRRRKVLPIARGLQIPDRRGRLRSLHRLAKLAEWCLCGSGGRSFFRRTPGSHRLFTSLKRWLAGSLVSSL